MDPNRPEGNDSDDERYVLEDDGASVEDIEHEMELTAQEAAESSGANDASTSTEAAEIRDRYLRTIADFENFRKRSEREKQDFYRYALTEVLKDLLPVLDNFDRALEHADEGDEFHRGVSLIYKQLSSTLQKAGLRGIDETGIRFDPNIHEGVVTHEDPSVPYHTVLEVLQKGYFLHDRLLRPAMVKVSVGGPDDSVRP